MNSCNTKFPKLPIQIAKKLQSLTTPLSFETPAKRNNRECAHAPYYFQKLESSAYIFVANSIWVCLHTCTNLCSGLQKTHLFCTRVLIGSSRSLKVIQGRWFWYQSKVHHCDYGPILHRFWDTWLKIVYFSYPSLIRRPRSPCLPWNFALKLTARKLESWGYPPVKTAWS